MRSIIFILFLLVAIAPHLPASDLNKTARSLKFDYSDMPVSSTNKVELAGGAGDVYTDVMTISKSEHHALSITWESADAAGTGTIEVLGWDGIKFKSFDSAVTISLSGTSYDKIKSISLPVTPAIKLKLSVGATHDTTFSALVLNEQ